MRKNVILPRGTHYFVITGIVLATALLGSWFASLGIASDWYESLGKPSWIPGSPVIGFIWTAIYILTAIAAIVFWELRKRIAHARLASVLFLMNAALNAGWPLVFFVFHSIKGGFFVAFALALTVISLIWMLWKPARLAAWLLVPYVLWGFFSVVMNYAIAFLNG